MSASPLIRRPPVVALAVLGVLACQGSHEIRYETEHLRIGTSFDEPLCRGDLDRLELVLTRAEMVLDAEVSKPIEVYLWSDFDWDPEGLCSSGFGSGCYDASQRAVYATPDSAGHELVHGVIESVASPASFWEEGTAEALTARTRFGYSAPVSNLELVPPQLDYSAASMFSRWLLETRGPELYRELIRYPGRGREAVESVYSMSAEDIQDEYFETSPYSYGSMVACDHAELVQQGPLAWAETINLDCDEEDVFGGPYGGMRASRVLEITARGVYALSTSAETITIGRCQDEDLELPPVLDDPAVGDIPFMTPASPEFERWFWGRDGPTSLELTPGRYELSISQTGYEANTYDVSVVADAGPVPQTPESVP